jgi:hypothetical protein
MARLIIMLIALAGPITSQALAAVVAEHTFATSHEGWTVTTGADRSSSATFNAADGQPPGSLHAADDNRPGFANRTWYFSSSNGPTVFGFGPNPFYGNLSAAYTGSLTYDLKRFVDPGAEYADYDVRLHGVIDADMNGSFETALTLSYGGPSLIPTAAGIWQSYSVPLLATVGWLWDRPTTDIPATEPQMLAVLSNLRMVEVRGNYSTPIGDYTGFDNVRFNSQIVPEPAAGFVATIGLFACALRRRNNDLQ